MATTPIGEETGRALDIVDAHQQSIDDVDLATHQLALGGIDGRQAQDLAAEYERRFPSGSKQVATYVWRDEDYFFTFGYRHPQKPGEVHLATDHMTYLVPQAVGEPVYFLSIDFLATCVGLVIRDPKTGEIFAAHYSWGKHPTHLEDWLAVMKGRGIVLENLDVKIFYGSESDGTATKRGELKEQLAAHGVPFTEHHLSCDINTVAYSVLSGRFQNYGEVAFDGSRSFGRCAYFRPTPMDGEI